MPIEVPVECRELLWEQHGVLGIVQAREAGASPVMILIRLNCCSILLPTFVCWRALRGGQLNAYLP